MNFEHLRGFVEVAHLGHFTRAADRLHVAQPTLSRQIATLEIDLGAVLFHRARGNVTLTAAGERLLPLARRMLADAETARSEMADLTELRRGRVRIGATPTLCTSLVADVVAEYRSRYPGIEIEVLERGSRSLIEALTEGVLDLAVIVTSVSSPAARAVLEREPILEEKLVLASSGQCLPVGEPSEGPRILDLADLAEVPQIVFPENYDLRAAVDAAFDAAGLSPDVAVTGAEMDAALSFIERGIGVAIVPAMVTLGRPLLRVHELADTSLTRTVSIARRSDMALTNAAAQVEAVIREVADRVSEPGAAASEWVQRAPLRR